MELNFLFKCRNIPSINKTYLRANNKVIKLKEVREFQKNLKEFIFYSYRKPILTNYLQIELKFYVKNINRDLDNMIKSTLDSLQGLIFKNDSQVYKLVAEKQKSIYKYELIEIKIKIL